MNNKMVRMSIYLLLYLLAPSLLFSEVEKSSKAKHYFYDSNHVRYELYRTNEGKPYNWLFLPGGPGADSSYFYSLIDELKLPGNVWLIDLPGNGDNIQEVDVENYDQWIDLFPKVIKQFDNPVLVGHSFGGMFPLLFPELENYLKGFVIVNSAPVLWQEEAVAYSKQFDLPDLSEDMRKFIQTPNEETFKAAVDACTPYYFSKQTLEQGRKFLSDMHFRYQPSLWWQKKVIELNFSAKWIPEKVPTLIIGAKYDCICPFSLFKNDKRFQRPNIELFFVEDAGHAFWLENPSAAKDAFNKIASRLSEIDK